MNGKKKNQSHPLPLRPETISYKKEIVFQPFQRILPINPWGVEFFFVGNSMATSQISFLDMSH